MEPNQIDVLSFPVLRHFQQIDNTQEPRLARQVAGNIRQIRLA